MKVLHLYLHEVIAENKRSRKDRRKADDNILIDINRRTFKDRRSGIVRRKHNRLKTKDGAFAVLMPNLSKLVQIIDINMDGLSVCYCDGKIPNKSSELGIFLLDSFFHVNHIPYKTTYDFEIPITIDFIGSSFKIRQRGLKFDGLTHYQKSKLGHLVRHHTAGVV